MQIEKMGDVDGCVCCTTVLDLIKKKKKGPEEITVIYHLI